MFISVIIASRSHAESLRQTLQSLFVDSNIKADDWEIIVVDNGSTDGTSQVCRDFAERYSGLFRPLAEPKPGKSNALNAGIAAARGNILAMTDDDVIFDAHYLDGIRTVFADNQVDAVMGRVLLDLAASRPSWFDDYCARISGMRDFGNHFCELQEGLTGANLIVRASLVRAIGGFCPDLRSDGKPACEDVEFHRRLRAAGYRLYFSPQIGVRLPIPPRRITKRHFLKRALINGRASAYFVPLSVPLWRFGLYAAKEIAVHCPVALAQDVAGKPGRGLRSRCDALERVAFFMQHWRFNRSGYPRLTAPRFSEPRVSEARGPQPAKYDAVASRSR